jgi:hypothetical protein
MRKNDRVEPPVAQRAKIRERFFALLFRVHPGIEDELLARRFEVITVRADLSAAREIDEFQFRLLLLLLLLLPGPIARRVLLNPSAQTVHQAHQHRDNFQQLLFPGANCGRLQ